MWTSLFLIAAISISPLSPAQVTRVAKVKTEMAKVGLDEREIEALFAKVKAYKVSELKGKPIKWKDFLANLYAPDSIARGKEFLRANAKDLEEAATATKVEKETIASLIRVESDLGRNTGNRLAMNVFYTALLGDRAGKWRNAALNMVELARFCKAANLDCAEVPASYAGAIGLCQFMPFSIRSFGFDADKDGVANLFLTKDAIWSAANFLSKHGWKKNHTRALERYYGIPKDRPQVALAYASAVLKYAKLIKN